MDAQLCAQGVLSLLRACALAPNSSRNTLSDNTLQAGRQDHRNRRPECPPTPSTTESVSPPDDLAQ